MSTPLTPSTHTFTPDSVSKTIDANLVKDGGFKDENLTNWTSNDAGSGVSEHDPLVMYEEFPSIRLKITNTTDDAERYQRLQPDTDSTSFEFSAMIQTENLGADDADKNVLIDVYYTDGTSELASGNADQKLTPSYDTQDWEQVTGSFSTDGEKKIEYLKLRCRLADISNQSGTGYMWVTQLVVIESADVKENETYNVDNDGDICVVPQLKITGTTIHFIDQVVDYSGSNCHCIIEATGDYDAQTFSPKQPIISKVGLYIMKWGAPDDDLIVELVPIDSSGDPDESIVLAQDIIAKESITTSYQLFEIDLPFSRLDITTLYAILCRSDATNLSGSIYYQIKGRNVNQYPDGKHYYTANAGTDWTVEETIDAIFYTKFPIHCGEPLKYRSGEYSSEDGTEYEFGKVGTEEEKQAQTFECDFTNRLYSVILKPFTKTGTPTDDYVIVSIQETSWDSTNSRWQPSGVILCEKRIAITDWHDRESTTFADGSIIEIVFGHPAQLKKQENYAIVIERSGSLSDTNHFAIHGSDTSNDNYADGKALHWDGDSWELGNANNDLYFAIRYTIDDTNIRLHNATIGDTLELEGQLLTSAEIQINRDGRGTYTHDYFDDTNWDEVCNDFIGDLRNTGGEYTIYTDNTYISGAGDIFIEYDFLFPCLSEPELSYKVDDATYIIYYSLDGAEWIQLTSGGDEAATAITIKIPVVNISKLYFKFTGTATIKIHEWELTANLDCSSAIGTLRLPGIGNSSCKSLFSNLNSKYTLDWEWIEVDNCDQLFVISDEPKYGYEMTAQVIPMGNPHPHTYHRTLKGSGIKQTSRYPALGGKMINVVDYSSNFADLAKLQEWLRRQCVVYIKTKYEFMQGILQEVPYKVISGEVNFRRLVIALDETRQL